jgi:hypothetical protein
VGIAEEGLDAEGLVKSVMLGELVSVVEADSFAYRLWKFTELTSDGPGGEDSLSINRVLNDAEAGLSFVENQQPLAASGEQHEVGFPMAGVPRPSTSAGRSVIERRCLMRLTGLRPGRRPRLRLRRGSRRCQQSF